MGVMAHSAQKVHFLQCDQYSSLPDKYSGLSSSHKDTNPSWGSTLMTSSKPNYLSDFLSARRVCASQVPPPSEKGHVIKIYLVCKGKQVIP